MLRVRYFQTGMANSDIHFMAFIRKEFHLRLQAVRCIYFPWEWNGVQITSCERPGLRTPARRHPIIAAVWGGSPVPVGGRRARQGKAGLLVSRVSQSLRWCEPFVCHSFCLSPCTSVCHSRGVVGNTWLQVLFFFWENLVHLPSPASPLTSAIKLPSPYLLSALIFTSVYLGACFLILDAFCKC